MFLLERDQQMTKGPCRLPPVILLGGAANALSVARSLGRQGIRVYALNEDAAAVRFSRYCRRIRAPWAGSDEATWTRCLLGRATDRLRGAGLLACSDLAIEIIAEHRTVLAGKFRLDLSDVPAQRAMLNKLATYQTAVAAGVPTPRFWVVDNVRGVLDLRGELTFPLLVKPLLSHVFGERFGKKFLVAANFDQLREAYEKVSQAQIETMLVEMIAGPDSLLCSYYTYLDENGTPLFDFTKRIIRRYPVTMGDGCCHVTDRNPEVRDLALRLFRAAGLRGLANAEFKRDQRDGKLKLIECNARFTAADCLVAESGFDLGLFVYNRLLGRPQKPLEKYRTGLHLWYPVRDFKAFLELRRRGELTWLQWLRSVLHPCVWPYFRWDDPVPALAAALRWARLDWPLRLTKKLVRAALRGLRAGLRSLTARRPADRQLSSTGAWPKSDLAKTPRSAKGKSDHDRRADLGCHSHV